VPEISEHNAAIGELPVFWRSAAAPADAAAKPPVLYLHGVPGNSDDWIAPAEHHGRRPLWKRWWRHKRATDEWVQPPAYARGFLERTGGLAPDLPGFGRSGKPGHFDYSIDGYADFIERFLDLAEVERVRLVVHDWGAVGLRFAQRHPARIARLVVTNAVPLLPDYRWHRVARAWRTPLLGELAMGSTTRWTLRRASREANATAGPLPEAWLDSVLAHFDQGTQRAILRLYRSAPSEALARAGLELGSIAAPALVVWGMRDPYIPARFAREYARALRGAGGTGGAAEAELLELPDGACEAELLELPDGAGEAELLELPDAGHWWWLDRPDAIARVVAFLERP
jgi:pimeloyl-ACP methyl ester carboxylesterase